MQVSLKLPRKIGGTVTVNLSDYGFPAGMSDIAVKLATYGLQQKRNDACAPLTQDKSAGADDYRARLAEIDSALRAGIWSQRSAAGAETWEAFITKFFIAAAKAQDKKNGKEDSKEGYATRAAAAIANEKFAPLIATKRAEYDALQAAPDADMDI